MAALLSRPRIRARNSTHSNDPLGNESSSSDCLEWLHILNICMCVHRESDTLLRMEALFMYQLTLRASQHVYTAKLSFAAICKLLHRDTERERDVKKEKPKKLFIKMQQITCVLS